uniref:DUF3370 domain-containing protein n=1 Tax=Microseira wollei TaxID=467598 RepID=UPI0027D9776B|nr:DUF3370 domain-containing protein [Microseira wollei]
MANSVLAQIAEPAVLERRFVTQIQEIRPLPGELDRVLVFNSNSPEVVQTEGILLSTFPGEGKQVPAAHLNKPLVGRFDFFSHHIVRSSRQGRTLYQGALVYNPNNEPVTLEILQAASHATNPDAPFVQLPSIVENPDGRVYSGPGSRVMNEVLRNVREPEFPTKIEIPPQQSRMLFNLPILPGSGRTTYMRLQASAPVYMANLAMYALANPRERFRAPLLEEWQNLLVTGRLAEPRDRTPTDPSKLGIEGEEKVFGRVAGVSIGSEWYARITDRPGEDKLSIPQRGRGISYPINTVTRITLGTNQVQSAPMAVRYADTAINGHGNYGVHYRAILPLVNNTGNPQTVTISIQTPFKQEYARERLFFVEPPQGRVFFRGTVRVSYRDDNRQPQVRYFHLVQRQGQQGEPLVTLRMPARDRRIVTVNFFYPPDATPPQVLSVRTLE